MSGQPVTLDPDEDLEEQARSWWAATQPGMFGRVHTHDLLALIGRCTATEARMVRILEESMPHPDRDVLDACDRRINRIVEPT